MNVFPKISENDFNNHNNIEGYLRLSKGVEIDGALGTCSWWLRSLGWFFDDSATVTVTGKLPGSSDTDKYCAVRPAMWIDLNP